jgi:N-acylneuraminate cytidylyltransferase
MNIAIITARGGSKRIPRKNIRPFLGKPMIAWPIEAARESGCFERVLVSTDDEEIAEIARLCGAEIPFLRPQNLADDFTPAHKAARHALEWALTNWGTVEAFCHIYPASPLLSPETLRQSMDIIASGAFKAAWAMLRMPFPVFQMMVESPIGGLERLFPADKADMRSQDMPAAYIDVGQSYAFATDYFLEHEVRIGPELTAVAVPRERALDIDTEDDWSLAERTARMLQAAS